MDSVRNGSDLKVRLKKEDFKLKPLQKNDSEEGKQRQREVRWGRGYGTAVLESMRKKKPKGRGRKTERHMFTYGEGGEDDVQWSKQQKLYQ